MRSELSLIAGAEPVFAHQRALSLRRELEVKALFEIGMVIRESWPPTTGEAEAENATRAETTYAVRIITEGSGSVRGSV